MAIGLFGAGPSLAKEGNTPSAYIQQQLRYPADELWDINQGLRPGLQYAAAPRLNKGAAFAVTDLPTGHRSGRGLHQLGNCRR